MDQQNPTLAKIPILETKKFEQWQFKIQQYLQHEHYALWEVTEFRDSYEVLRSTASTTTTDTTSGRTGKKSRRTVTLTAEDMQKRKNDVKARTTLLLSLPDEHQLRFSKYKTTQELWAAILKTFSGNEATKKTKKILLKQQYGNFKAEGLETLEQTLNRLQVIVEWLMQAIVWRNRSDLDTMSLDDLYNHIKVYESEVQKKSELNSQNMAFISSAKHSRGNEDVNTASVSTASTNDINKINEYDMEEMDIKWNMALLNMRADKFWKKTGKKIRYSVVPPPPTQNYSSSKKDLSWTGLSEFANDTVTDYSRPSPTMESTSGDDQNRNPSVPETDASPSTITPKPFIKFVKPNDIPSKSKTGKTETPKKPLVNSQNNIDEKGYWDSGCSRHMTGNISYLFDYEPFDEGYVSFGQGGCKITSKGTIKTSKLEFKNVYFVKDLKDFKLLDDANILLRTPRQHNMYSINLNNIVPHKDLTCLVAKASADECMLWHKRP
nr:hypothetical protein [Tanacetum cinerariifolium]